VTESISIRRATADDAADISAIWEAIVAERDYSAVARAFTPEEEKTFIGSLSPREAVFVAQAANQVAGFQSLDLWVRYLASMDHVGQVGTFVRREWRGQGIGRQLAERTLAFARENGYEKLVIFVRAKNLGAQSFYKRLGFVECGRFARQVKIEGEYDDEILMELFL
jgi:L-amino acid N-acyltransferase YncA